MLKRIGSSYRIRLSSMNANKRDARDIDLLPDKCYNETTFEHSLIIGKMR